MAFRRFFGELRRRKVIRVTIGYAVIAWVVVQIASDVLTAFDLSGLIRYVIYSLIVGLPIVVVLSWIFDITPTGIVKTAASDIVGAAPERATPVSKNSIAVLPFDSIGDAGKVYFADGLAEEMINRLAGIDGLHVAARTSSFSFRDTRRDTRTIGRELGVAHILEGSVQSSTDRVRVSARLIEAKTGYHLWSERFDRRLDDIFEIQDDISNAVATALSAKLVSANSDEESKPTRSFVAYNLYLQGRHLWHRRTKSAFYQALTALESAVQLDPEFAAAHVAIADVYGLLYEYGDLSLEEAAKHVERQVELALRNEPDMSQAHAIKALIIGHQDRWQEAEALFIDTIDKNPNYAMVRMWYGNLLAALGRFRDADAAYQDAYRLDPLSPIVNINIAQNWYHMGRHEEALARLREVIRVSPEFAGTYRNLNLILSTGDDLADVFRWYRKAAELDPESWILPANMAMLLIDLGEMERADRMLKNASAQAPGQGWLVNRRRWWYLARADFDGLHRYFGERLASFPDNDAAIASMGFAEMMLGNAEKAIELFRRSDPACQAHGPLMNARQTSWGFMHGIDLAQLLIDNGHAEQGQAFLARCRAFLESLATQAYAEPVGDYLMACICSVQGNPEEALDKLEQAVDAGFRHHWRLCQNVNLRALQNMPRFEDIVSRSKEQAIQRRERLAAAEKTLKHPFVSAI